MRKGFKRKNPGNQSIRRQLTFYMGFFVVLPLCLALMLLNFYLQKVTTENKINNETNLLSQIRDNADQMIEVTNYATSMLDDKQKYAEEPADFMKQDSGILRDLSGEKRTLPMIFRM
ncbi:MAG: hypothetical protein ACLUGJ_14700 [Blautia wexlerae]